jgi:hypothetical protein
MASKKKVSKPRPVAWLSKAVGEWLITCEGNGKKHPWAEDLPAGAEFKITLENDGQLYFEPGPGCRGRFRGRRKRLTTVAPRPSSLVVHDGHDVTAHSFRLHMKANRTTFVLSGFRQPASRAQDTDEGSIAIETVSRSLDHFIATIRRPAILNITHGGPHGEPKQRLMVAAAAGTGHKLIGRWKIVDQGDDSTYRWAAGLPVGAVFEITQDLEFVPGDGCRDLFGDRRKAERWSGRLPLRHEGEHEHVPLLDDETLRLTLTDGSVITLNGSRQRKPRKRKGRVSFSGPRADLAALFLTHGGPHGEPD